MADDEYRVTAGTAAQAASFVRDQHGAKSRWVFVAPANPTNDGFAWARFVL